MSEKIEPALTAEEWEEKLIESEAFKQWFGIRSSGGIQFSADMSDNGRDDLIRPHAVATLCLYGQPFGFTRRDADAIRIAAESANTPAHYEALHNLADRLESLLPPEK